MCTQIDRVGRIIRLLQPSNPDILERNASPNTYGMHSVLYSVIVFNCCRSQSEAPACGIVSSAFVPAAITALSIVKS